MHVWVSDRRSIRACNFAPAASPLAKKLQAFSKDRRLHFPLLADFEPKGSVARAYGAYRESEGVAERALFVLDRNGVVFWSYRSPIAVNPGAEGILDALERLNRRDSHDAQGSGHAA